MSSFHGEVDVEKTSRGGIESKPRVAALHYFRQPSTDRQARFEKTRIAMGGITLIARLLV
jgi:hypothetical protein